MMHLVETQHRVCMQNLLSDVEILMPQNCNMLSLMSSLTFETFFVEA